MAGAYDWIIIGPGIAAWESPGEFALLAGV